MTVNAAPSCEDISHMIRLCPDYSLLGGRLLDTATSLANERAEGTTLRGGNYHWFVKSYSFSKVSMFFFCRTLELLTIVQWILMLVDVSISGFSL